MKFAKVQSSLRYSLIQHIFYRFDIRSDQILRLSMSTTLLEETVRDLFERYYFSLVEFSYRLVGCNDTARDIVQDVYVKLLEDDLLILSDDPKAKPYLYAIVKNASLNKLRWSKVRAKYTEQKMLEMESIEDNTLDALIYAEAIHKLHTAMQSLPKACQTVCYLSYFEEKSNQEVAEITQTSINTVKTHKQRALKILRDVLSPDLRIIKIFILLFFSSSFIPF